MAKTVLLDPAWEAHPAAKVLGDFDAVESLVKNHPGFMARTTSKAYRMQVQGLPVFIKYYQRVHEKEGVRIRHFVRSKPFREWRNLGLFRRFGIATTPAVAAGERRRLGVFNAGYLVTHELESAQELGTLAREAPDHVRDEAFFGPLCTLLAQAVSTMHSHNFFHNDLNVRNVLVRETDGMEVFVFDSPNGRRWIFPFREFRLIKDLSHLDKVACRVLRRTQRLRFYLAYRGTTRLTRADKRRLQRIVRRSALPLGQELKDRKNFIE